jgi:hypothetical protein
MGPHNISQILLRDVVEYIIIINEEKLVGN